MISLRNATHFRQRCSASQSLLALPPRYVDETSVQAGYMRPVCYSAVVWDRTAGEQGVKKTVFAGGLEADAECIGWRFRVRQSASLRVPLTPRLGAEMRPA